jgi:RND family efflux transporter MFP subunit
MNMNRSFFPARVSACAMAVLCTLTITAQAADRPAKFVVASSQVQALGIQTMPLQNQAESVRTSYPAQVVMPPNAERVISSPVMGLILQLLVQPNQMVRAGAPLVRIASSELGQLQLQLLQASARATLARQAAQREKDLFDEGLIAQRRVQEAQAAMQEAEATLKQAKTALRLGGMPLATIDRVAASGNPQDSLVLSATQAGVVTEIKVKPGQRVDASTPLLHLAQTGTLWLEIQVPVADSGGWAPGTPLKAPGRDITARILSSGATVAADSQMVVMRAVVQGKVGQVRPGELLSVELPVAATAGGWDLPLSAVAHDDDQAYVFVRTPDGFEARPVKVVASAAQRVRVQGPVKAGEQVAVSGVVALKGAWLNDRESK